METKQDITKAYHNMIPVQLTLAQRFYDFIKGYLAFFGKHTTVEDFCRDTVYETIRILYQSFEIQNRNPEILMHIPDTDWFKRWDALAFIVVPEDKDLPSYETGVQFTNKEFLRSVEEAAENQHMDRDEFIRSVLRKELRSLNMLH